MERSQEAEGEVLDRAASGLLHEIHGPTLSLRWEDSLEAFKHLFLPFGGAKAVYWKTAQYSDSGSPCWVRVNMELQVGSFDMVPKPANPDEEEECNFLHLTPSHGAGAAHNQTTWKCRPALFPALRQQSYTGLQSYPVDLDDAIGTEAAPDVLNTVNLVNGLEHEGFLVAVSTTPARPVAWVLTATDHPLGHDFEAARGPPPFIRQDVCLAEPSAGHEWNNVPVQDGQAEYEREAWFDKLRCKREAMAEKARDVNDDDLPFGAGSSDWGGALAYAMGGGPTF